LTFFLVLIWSAVVSGVELTSLGFSTLILIMLIAVFFLYLNFLNSFIYFAGSFIALVVTVSILKQFDQSLIPMLFVIFPVTVISILVSGKNVKSKVNELVNSEKLTELNHELNTIKDHLEDEVEKRTQELYVAKEKAEESDRLKSAFLANMSHEIRTPMNGILGFAGLLKEPNLSGEEQHKYISIIEKGGERMLNIINNLVDISKIEAGLMEVSISETSVNKLIEYFYTFFKPEAERKGLQFFVRSTLPENEVLIKTDQEKIYAIFTHLVKNAIKYCENGFIELGCSIKPGKARNETNDDVPARILFYVKDTGIGIANERQEAIFERFIQADIEDRRAFQGAGLGLSISKAYVEMLGGRMWMESEEGVGSVFFFTIPYNPDPVRNFAEDHVLLSNHSGNERKKLNIVIAEDDETSELFLDKVFGTIAKKIFKTTTGAETVDICRKNPDIDLVMMDMQMPNMNGYEATRQIRQFNNKMIIIAQTAFALEGDREKAIESGCNDYLTKPLDPHLLLESIQKHIKIL
jgi:signal transduction histidine kinase/CheY-like chemotaxis protein